MAIVFKTPKSALNTTTKTIQNLANGDCPPCPDCPEVSLDTADVTYTENGEYTLTPEGDGFSQVDITVNIDTQAIADDAYDSGYADGETAGQAAGYQTGYAEGVVDGEAQGIEDGIAAQKAKLTSLNVSANGSYTREDGYNSVTVAVPTPQPALQSKSVNPSTSQQTATPDSNYDGLSQVTVNAVTSSIDNNITASNIKSGVTILGVTGTVQEGITPTGSINITNTKRTDVTNYATAQVVDANLAAGNIKSGVSILGVTGTMVAPNLESKSFEPTMLGNYEITPEAPYNGISQVNIAVQSDIVGSFWNPFEVMDTLTIVDLNDRMENVEDYSGFFNMLVDSGSIDSETGYYVAEDENGNVFHIVPYNDNPDYDPENPDPNVPEQIFPEGFDLVGLSIQVETALNEITISIDDTDPEVVLTTVEIPNGNLSGINFNSDMESWHYYWDGTLSGGIETSTRNLQLTTNEEGRMSIASSEPWEIELDIPSVQRSLAKGLTKAPVVQPTLEVDQMSGNAGVYTLNVFSPEDQNTGFTLRGLNSGDEVYVEVNSMGDYFTIISEEDNNTITIDHSTDSLTTVLYDFEYSLSGGETWESAINRRIEVTLDSGEEIKVRSTGINDTLYYPSNGYEQFKFNSTGEVSLGGNLCSLLDPTNFSNYQLITSDVFYKLFAFGTTGLKVIDASALILPSRLTSHCFQSMFEGNTYLELPPELPATYVPEYAYASMFKGCTNLSTTPALPANVIESYSYDSMFEGSNIPDVPELPAKYLNSYCYRNMFKDCVSINTIPQDTLLSTTLADYCYYGMFRGCINLVNVPVDLLPATRLYQYCYSNMFNGCTSLDVVINLPAVSLTNGSGARNCYDSMFSGCASLSEAPELPATSLSTQCYQYMFSGCTSLTESPILAYYEARVGVYNGMFSGCTSLTKVTCLATTIGTGTFAGTNSWLYNVAATGIFYKDPNATWTLDSTSGVPSGWTVEDYVEPSN